MQKIQVEGKDLQNALGIASRVAPPTEGNVILIGKASKLYVFSMSELARCETIVPAKIEGKDFEFAIPLDALRDATKGRDTLELTWDGNLLGIRSSGYKADLITIDAISRDELDKVTATEASLSAEQAVWLKSTVNDVALKPTAMLAAFMPVTVKLTAKGAFVACYDNQHMAFTNSNEVTGELMLTLPLDSFQTILDVFGSSSIKLKVSNSRVEIRNKLTFIAMSLPSMEDSVSAEDVISKAREAMKTAGTALVLDKQAVLAFLDNARSVMGKERIEVTANSDAGKIKFVVKTVRGTINAIVKATGKKASFKIDFEYFQEMVQKTKGAELELSVVTDAFISSKYEGGIALVALNQ